MLTRRQWLRAGLTASIAAQAAKTAEASADQESVAFIHLTDPHVIYPPGVHPRLLEMRKMFASTIATLPQDLDRIQRDGLGSFAFITGDLIDVYSFLAADGGIVDNQVEAFSRIVNNAPLPVYCTLGNHDVQHYGVYQDRLLADQSVVGPARAAWIRQLPCFQSGVYYAMHRTVGGVTYRIVALDNGFYGHQPSYLPKREAAYTFGRGQLDWLRRICADDPAEPLVLGIHIPPTGVMLEELTGALGKRTAPTVMLVGHLHNRQDVTEIKTADLTLYRVDTPGYCNSRDHWRQVRLLADRIQVGAVGKPGEVQLTIPLG
ncbi:MAG: metallophosphoesterase [Bryobacterales bacterium]|jgi:3',5'-cyclic AMP phosphodiesterase CpdA|nr:metallophosphoesterase [Bryobacterales bacterium]